MAWPWPRPKLVLGSRPRPGNKIYYVLYTIYCILYTIFRPIVENRHFPPQPVATGAVFPPGAFFRPQKTTFREKSAFFDFFIYGGFGARDLSSKKTRAAIPCINPCWPAPSLPRGVKICKKSLAKGSGPSQHIWAGETTNVHSGPYPRPTRPGKNKCVS